jgi:hypothetical protein
MNLWFSRAQESLPSFSSPFITLITYLFSLLLFACLACLCAGLCSCTLDLSPHPVLYPGCSLINIRDSVFFSLQSFYFCLFKVFLPKFFHFPPPWVLPPTFRFSVSFTPTLSPNFLTSFSQLASLPACCCCV